MCTVSSAEDEIKGHDPDAGPKNEATCHACHPIASDWEGPGRDRLWVGSRLNWRSMVDTSVLDARKHGPAIARSITTELRLTCEAPSAKRWRTAGSSETSFALILRPDKIQGFLYSQEVREMLKEKPLASTRAKSPWHHQHVSQCQLPCPHYYILHSQLPCPHYYILHSSPKYVVILRLLFNITYYIPPKNVVGGYQPPTTLLKRYVIRNISKYWTKNDSITTITTNYYMITTNYSYWKLVPLLIPTVTTNYCIITTYYFHHYYQLLHHYYILLKIKVKIGANHYDVILQFTTYYLFLIRRVICSNV
jgi:hypothetical protein